MTEKNKYNLENLSVDRNLQIITQGKIDQVSFLIEGDNKDYFQKIIESFKAKISEKWLTRDTELANNPNIQNNPINYIIKDSVDPSIQVINSSKYLINGPINDDSFVDQIPHICYCLSEKYRQEKLKQLSVHGCAVEKNGKGVLILGDKGTGKTNLLIALCMNHGYSFIGNDVVVISGGEKLSLVFGNQQMNVRVDTIRNLNPFFAARINLDDLNNGYETKKSYSTEELGINSCNHEVFLSHIVRINTHVLNGDYKETPVLSLPIEALRLNENMSRYIRGMTTPLMLSKSGSIKGYFPSQDNSELCNFRNNLVERLLGEVPFSYISGNDSSNIAKNYDLSH